MPLNMQAVRALELRRVDSPFIRIPNVIRLPGQSVPHPATPAVPSRLPQLFLIEHYQLSSFIGDLVRDRIVSNLPPIAPHTTTTFKLVTRKKTETELSQSTTVLDSLSAQSRDDFNQSMANSADSKFGNEHYDYGMQGNFHGEGSIGFGEATADAHVDVAGSTNNVRQEFVQSVSGAIDSQVSRSSEARREQVSVLSGDQKTETETYTETTMTHANNSDKVENIAVFQVKQETVSILSLSNVELGFRNGVEAEGLQAPLFDCDRILQKVIADSDLRRVVKQRIATTLQNIRGMDGTIRSAIVADASAGEGGFRFDKGLTSTYDLKRPDGSVRHTIEVPGVIMDVYRRYLVLPNVAMIAPIELD